MANMVVRRYFWIFRIIILQTVFRSLVPAVGAAVPGHVSTNDTLVMIASSPEDRNSLLSDVITPLWKDLLGPGVQSLKLSVLSDKPWITSSTPDGKAVRFVTYEVTITSPTSLDIDDVRKKFREEVVRQKLPYVWAVPNNDNNTVLLSITGTTPVPTLNVSSSNETNVYPLQSAALNQTGNIIQSKPSAYGTDETSSTTGGSAATRRRRTRTTPTSQFINFTVPADFAGNDVLNQMKSAWPGLALLSNETTPNGFVEYSFRNPNFTTEVTATATDQTTPMFTANPISAVTTALATVMSSDTTTARWSRRARHSTTTNTETTPSVQGATTNSGKQVHFTVPADWPGNEILNQMKAAWPGNTSFSNDTAVQPPGKVTFSFGEVSVATPSEALPPTTTAMPMAGTTKRKRISVGGFAQSSGFSGPGGSGAAASAGGFRTNDNPLITDYKGDYGSDIVPVRSDGAAPVVPPSRNRNVPVSTTTARNNEILTSAAASTGSSFISVSTAVEPAATVTSAGSKRTTPRPPSPLDQISPIAFESNPNPLISDYTGDFRSDIVAATVGTVDAIGTTVTFGPPDEQGMQIVAFSIGDITIVSVENTKQRDDLLNKQLKPLWQNALGPNVTDVELNIESETPVTSKNGTKAKQIQYSAQGTADAPVPVDAVRDQFHQEVVKAKLPNVLAVPDSAGNLQLLPPGKAAGITVPPPIFTTTPAVWKNATTISSVLADNNEATTAEDFATSVPEVTTENPEDVLSASKTTTVVPKVTVSNATSSTVPPHGLNATAVAIVALNQTAATTSTTSSVNRNGTTAVTTALLINQTNEENSTAATVANISSTTVSTLLDGATTSTPASIAAVGMNETKKENSTAVPTEATINNSTTSPCAMSQFAVDDLIVLSSQKHTERKELLNGSILQQWRNAFGDTAENLTATIVKDTRHPAKQGEASALRDIEYRVTGMGNCRLNVPKTIQDFHDGIANASIPGVAAVPNNDGTLRFLNETSPNVTRHLANASTPALTTTQPATSNISVAHRTSAKNAMLSTPASAKTSTTGHDITGHTTSPPNVTVTAILSNVTESSTASNVTQSANTTETAAAVNSSSVTASTIPMNENDTNDNMVSTTPETVSPNGTTAASPILNATLSVVVPQTSAVTTPPSLTTTVSAPPRCPNDTFSNATPSNFLGKRPMFAVNMRNDPETFELLQTIKSLKPVPSSFGVHKVAVFGKLGSVTDLENALLYAWTPSGKKIEQSGLTLRVIAIKDYGVFSEKGEPVVDISYVVGLKPVNHSARSRLTSSSVVIRVPTLQTLGSRLAERNIAVCVCNVYRGELLHLRGIFDISSNVSAYLDVLRDAWEEHKPAVGCNQTAAMRIFTGPPLTTIQPEGARMRFTSVPYLVTVNDRPWTSNQSRPDQTSFAKGLQQKGLIDSLYDGVEPISMAHSFANYLNGSMSFQDIPKVNADLADFIANATDQSSLRPILWNLEPFTSPNGSVLTQEAFFIALPNGQVLDPRLFYAGAIKDIMANRTSGVSVANPVIPLYLYGQLQDDQWPTLLNSLNSFGQCAAGGNQCSPNFSVTGVEYGQENRGNATRDVTEVLLSSPLTVGDSEILPETYSSLSRLLYDDRTADVLDGSLKSLNVTICRSCNYAKLRTLNLLRAANDPDQKQTMGTEAILNRLAASWNESNSLTKEALPLQVQLVGRDDLLANENGTLVSQFSYTVTYPRPARHWYLIREPTVEQFNKAFADLHAEPFDGALIHL